MPTAGRKARRLEVGTKGGVAPIVTRDYTSLLWHPRDASVKKVWRAEGQRGWSFGTLIVVSVVTWNRRKSVYVARPLTLSPTVW